MNGYHGYEGDEPQPFDREAYARLIGSIGSHYGRSLVNTVAGIVEALVSDDREDWESAVSDAEQAGYEAANAVEVRLAGAIRRAVIDAAADHGHRGIDAGM